MGFYIRAPIIASTRQKLNSPSICRVHILPHRNNYVASPLRAKSYSLSKFLDPRERRDFGFGICNSGCQCEGFSGCPKLCEQRTAEKCYFCNAPGHRAFACSSMLRLACSWGQVTGQAKYGLWCSSCAFSNTTIALARGEDVKKVSGWYVHTRSACHSKDILLGTLAGS